MARKTGKAKQLWADFKKFISRGSVIDMAIGVVIGGAFSAIITSVVAILTTLCTWMIPGGIEGLITVLPAADFPEALSVIGQSFNTASLKLSKKDYDNTLELDDIKVVKKRNKFVIFIYVLLIIALLAGIGYAGYQFLK